MARTESKSMQVHPSDEQEIINLMQKFHWSLLSTQEIKVKDSHLEGGKNWAGEKTIVSVTEAEHYVKLAFSRDLDLPNLKKIKQLEDKYFLLPLPNYPKLFPISIWLWVVGAVIYGIGIIGWVVYFFASYTPKKEIADKTLADLLRNRSQILEEMEQYS